MTTRKDLNLYCEVKSVKDLHAFLTKLIEQGRGNAILQFDTEGKKFNYCMALIGGVSWLHKDPTGVESLIFHEADKKQEKSISYFYENLRGEGEI